MASGTPLDQIVKSLAFGVEAVAQDVPSSCIGTSKDMPLNVKVKVRKKEESNLCQGFLSVPRINNPDQPPERIRLISSDQTIMSFNMVMEGADFTKKTKKKPRKFFGGCLGTKHDDDEYAYSPKTKTMLKSNGEHKKSIIIISKINDDRTGIVKPFVRDFGILGQCRPGGCLDPPFSEDKYQYGPSIKEQSFPTKTITAEKIEEQINVPNKDTKQSTVSDEQKKLKDNKPKNTKEKAKNTSIVNLYEAETMKDSLDSKYSDSIITYPPVESSSTNLIGKNTRGRISSEEKQRKSNDESIVSFFKPIGRTRESTHERDSKDSKKYKKFKETTLGKDAPQKEEMQKVTPKDMIRSDIKINTIPDKIILPSKKEKLALQTENSFVSLKSKGTIISYDTNDTTALHKNEDEMVSEKTKDAMITQINNDKMDSQGPKNGMISQGPKDSFNSKEIKAEMVVQGSKDAMVTQGTKIEMDSQRTKDEIILQETKDEIDSYRTKDSFFSHGDKDETTSHESKDQITSQDSKDTTVSKGTKDELVPMDSKNKAISHEAKEGVNSEETKDKDQMFQQKIKDGLDPQETKDGINSKENKDEINSKGTQYDIITQENKNVMIQQRTKDGKYTQGTEDEMISQGSNNRMIVQETKDVIDGTKNKMFTEESKEGVIFQETNDGAVFVEGENTMVYKETEDETVSKKSEDEMVFYETKDGLVSQESESVMINQETKLDMTSQENIDEIVSQESKKAVISPENQQVIVNGDNAYEINKKSYNYSTLEQDILRGIENVVANTHNLDTQYKNYDEVIKRDSTRFDGSKNSKISSARPSKSTTYSLKSDGNEINTNKIRLNNQRSNSTDLQPELSVSVQTMPDLSQDNKNIHSQYMPSLNVPNLNKISSAYIDNQILAPINYRRGSKSSLKKDTITLDFGFQSYVNEDKEKVFKTIETLKEPVRYPDDYVTFIKTQIKPNNNEIRISVDLENEMLIQFKRNKSPQRVQISDEKRNRYTIPQSEPQNKSNASVFDNLSNSKIVNPEMINIIYEKGLLPLHKSIHGLKKEIDALTKQQTVLKEKLVDPKRKKSYRILGINHNCSCKRH